MDEAIHGGLPRPSITALIGPPGAGTTSFCKSFVVSSLLRGMKVLIALGDEPPDHYMRNFDSVKSLDMRSYVDQKRLFFLDEYSEYAGASGMKALGDLSVPEDLQAQKIMLASKNSMAKQMGVDTKRLNVVTDSITALSPFIGIREVHRVVLDAQASAAEFNHVMIFAAHEGALEGNFVQILKQYADGVIRLRSRWVRGKLRREMLIEKMRFTEITEPVLEYRINDDGIEIL